MSENTEKNLFFKDEMAIISTYLFSWGSLYMDFSPEPLSHSQLKIDWDSELLEAATEGNFEQFRKAFTHGANINVKNIFGQSALILAAEHSNKEIVGLIVYLHHAGMSVELNAKCNAGYTPLMLATINCDKEIVKILLPLLTLEQLMTKDMGGSTALMWAAEKGDTEIFNLMISYFKDKKECMAEQLDVQDGLDYTCLMHAAEKGHANIVTIIIQELNLEPENLNKQNCWGQTATNLAATQGHTRIFEMLREAGADLELSDFNGKTPLDNLESQKDDDATNRLAELLMKFEFNSPDVPPADAVMLSRSLIESKSEKKRQRLPMVEILFNKTKIKHRKPH